MRHICFLLLLLAFHQPTHASLPGGDALAGLIIGEFDANSDTKLDTGEWQSGVGGSFDTMDKDGDSHLSAPEASSFHSDVASKTGTTMATVIVALIEKVIMSLDKDNDGKVSRTEYQTLSNSMFTKLDADHDGTATTAELAQLPTKMLGL
jgi:Ca2+-binding EF-hand superfamily protein